LSTRAATPPWPGSTPRICSESAGDAVGESHERILCLKREFIEDLARDRADGDAEGVDVLLAVADRASRLGRWIRGDQGSDAAVSVASFVFVGGDARLLLRGIPSSPGLVALVVNHHDEGLYFRFICGAAQT
jgi:hypothetical protein